MNARNHNLVSGIEVLSWKMCNEVLITVSDNIVLLCNTQN